MLVVVLDIDKLTIIMCFCKLNNPLIMGVHGLTGKCMCVACLVTCLRKHFTIVYECNSITMR